MLLILNIINQVPGRILIVLEYCKGGDLSMYIQRHGKVPEAIAKHFMQQLGIKYILCTLSLISSHLRWLAKSDGIVFNSCWFANSPGQ